MNYTLINPTEVISELYDVECEDIVLHYGNKTKNKQYYLNMIRNDCNWVVYSPTDVNPKCRFGYLTPINTVLSSNLYLLYSYDESELYLFDKIEDLFQDCIERLFLNERTREHNLCTCLYCTQSSFFSALTFRKIGIYLTDMDLKNDFEKLFDIKINKELLYY